MITVPLTNTKVNILPPRKLHISLTVNEIYFSDKDVLIVGGFVSGVELMMDITKVAKSIVLSHRELFIPLTPPTNVELKASVVKEFTETGAIFADGTAQNFSNILYCTGYKYTLPFLSVDCGIHLDQNFVYPVYRHCINIMHPSMYFIGLPHRLATFLLSDIQVNKYAKFRNFHDDCLI